MRHLLFLRGLCVFYAWSCATNNTGKKNMCVWHLRFVYDYHAFCMIATLFYGCWAYSCASRTLGKYTGLIMSTLCPWLLRFFYDCYALFSLVTWRLLLDVGLRKPLTYPTSNHLVFSVVTGRGAFESANAMKLFVGNNQFRKIQNTFIQ